MSKKNLILSAVCVVAIGGALLMLTRTGSGTAGSPADTARRMASGAVDVERAPAREAVSRQTPAAPGQTTNRLTPSENEEADMAAEAAPASKPRIKARPASRRRTPKKKATKDDPDIEKIVPAQAPEHTERRGSRATRKP